jgi:hypothetical protein
MTVNLPMPIAAYFAADRTDSETVVQCFADNAVVRDDGCEPKGLAAIRAWKSASSKKYTYTREPFASEDKDGKTIVASRLAGNFPGSPLNLRYFFGLEG